jgi:hypothetical protein
MYIMTDYCRLYSQKTDKKQTRALVREGRSEWDCDGKTRSNSKLQTRPLVWENTPQRQDSNIEK